MVRIALALAIFSIALLVTNIVLGLRTGDYNGVVREYNATARQLRELRGSAVMDLQQVEAQEAMLLAIGQQAEKLQSRSVLHFLFGLAASLVTVLVNSVTVTYFIGTSRWCKEVSDAYQLDSNLAIRSVQLKRTTFAWALVGNVAILVIIALGGASLPFGRNAVNAADFVAVHFIAAILGTALVCWSFLVQAGNISANHAVISEILLEVDKIKSSCGLEDGLEESFEPSTQGTGGLE